eukprot:5656517-Amphidinium_carterae.1
MRAQQVAIEMDKALGVIMQELCSRHPSSNLLVPSEFCVAAACLYRSRENAVYNVSASVVDIQELSPLQLQHIYDGAA